ncbi:Spy/CpxP family protein refolding chaperone [Mucilaginibacter sp.]
MKKFLLMCCFIVGITAASHAQGGGMRMSTEDRVKAMQTQLKLTDAQTAQITAIFKTAAAKRDSVMNAGGDRTAMRPIMMDANQKIQAILTPDQQAAYKQMMADMRAKMQNGGGNGGGN